MHKTIKALRSALEMQHAIQGTLVPLGSNDAIEQTIAPETTVEEITAVEATISESTAEEPVLTESDTVVAIVDAASETVVQTQPVTLKAPSETPKEHQPVIIKTSVVKTEVAKEGVVDEVLEIAAPSISASESANTDLFGNKVNPAHDTSLSPYERLKSLIPSDSPLHHMDTLEEVSAYVANTVLIPLDEQRKNPVFGVGNPMSDLMVIGEAPGADEDNQGEPFVGRAGQLLNKIMGAINFERKEIYIANILKSRPPNNRDPHPDEIAAHIPILYKQITLIQPKVILCVGKTAGNTLLGKSSSLASLRGKFNDFYGIPVMVTYHPAALLRNPHWKRPTWEDVQLLRTRFDELVS